MIYEIFSLPQDDATPLAHYLTLRGSHYQGLLFWHPHHFIAIDQTIMILPQEAGRFWYDHQRYRIDYDGKSLLHLAIAIPELA